MNLLRRTAAVVSTAAVVVAILPTVSSQAAAAEPARSGRPIPVIYDSDMDFDDASTLAYLCEEHKLGRIDLRAVTVANNGFGEPSRTLRHARSVLEQCGLPRVPVAEGATGAGVHPAPPELVATIETVLTGALGDGDRPPYQAPLSAVQLITRTVLRSARPVTILATGPLTNLSAALDSPRVAGRVGRVQLMGGALAVPGNLYGSALPGFDNSQEFNMWMDPVSARDLLRRARPGSVHMVPLDATAAVPITPDFIDPAGRGPARARRPAGATGSSASRTWSRWSTSASCTGGTRWRRCRRCTTTAPSRRSGRSGSTWCRPASQSGRTVVVPTGRLVQAAFDADREVFERRFVDSLNGRR